MFACSHLNFHLHITVDGVLIIIASLITLLTVFYSTMMAGTADKTVVKNEQEKTDDSTLRQAAIERQFDAIVGSAARNGDCKPAAGVPSAAVSETPVNPDELLKHADKLYTDRMKKIQATISNEQKQILQQLETKKRSLEVEAKNDFKRQKTAIMNSLPSSGQCSMCQARFKIPTAQCVEDDCNVVLCVSCAAKIRDGYTCVICKRQKAKAMAIQNVKCPSCIKSTRYLEEFSYCRDGCGFICPEHTHEFECCVCGYSTFCITCEIGSCGRCGRNLCDRCDIKEGCMCAEYGGRRGFGFY